MEATPTVLEHGRVAPLRIAPRLDPEHAGRIRQRQAGRRATAALALLCLALLVPMDRVLAQDDAGASGRERQLQNEQRLLRGRIQTLDRELAPYERQQLRTPSPDPLTGRPRSVNDPLAERKELERRTLQDRERMIDQDLRRQQFERTTRGGR
jgi:hypothetical protein